MVSAVSQAVELFRVGSQSQERVQLFRQITQHLILVLSDFLQVAQLLRGAEDRFDVDARIDGERVPDQVREVEEEGLGGREG